MKTRDGSFARSRKRGLKRHTALGSENLQDTYAWTGRPDSKSAFTLVELLTVMAIISILAGLTMSSLQFSGAAKLKAAGGTMSDTVAFARQNSISQDAFTAVVVQTTGLNAYTTYCLIQLKRDMTTGGFSTSTWQPLTAWRHLDRGVVFDKTASVTGSQNFFNATGSLMNAPATLSYQGQSIDLASSTVFQVFAPDGTLTETQPLRLRVVRGTWNSTSNSISYQGSETAGAPNDYYDILFLPDTGQTKIEVP